MSTAGELVDLSALLGRTVVYCYSRTGRPGEGSPRGWDEIPGARVFGLSTQSTEYQREAAEQLRLPFALLSDEKLAFARALRLPTFEVEGMTLIKRLTLVADEGRIEEVFYPVFPPDENAKEVAQWLSRNARAGRRR
jgi:peroxiredoxin